MKKFIIAVSAISFLSLTAFGQVRQGFTANNHPTTRAASSKTDDAVSRLATNTPIAPGGQTVANAVRQRLQPILKPLVLKMSRPDPE